MKTEDIKNICLSLAALAMMGCFICISVVVIKNFWDRPDPQPQYIYMEEINAQETEQENPEE